VKQKIELVHQIWQKRISECIWLFHLQYCIHTV
jgi:hypothetical protein